MPSSNTTDWFKSRYSDSDLAEILSDYHKSVHGFRKRMHGAGRCTLVRELESLDAYSARYGFYEQMV
jgi:hypothetical protein